MSHYDAGVQDCLNVWDAGAHLDVWLAGRDRSPREIVDLAWDDAGARESYQGDDPSPEAFAAWRAGWKDAAVRLVARSIPDWERISEE